MLRHSSSMSYGVMEIPTSSPFTSDLEGNLDIDRGEQEYLAVPIQEPAPAQM